MFNIALLIPFVAMAIPIVAITLSHRERMEKNRIRELELRKEVLELENRNQDGKLRLLEEENRRYDRIIGDSEKR